RVVIVVFCLVWISGCGLDIIEFDVIEEGYAGLTGVNLPGLGGFSSSLQSGLSGQGVDPGDVDSMRILSGTLEMTSQGGITEDLSFFKKLDFNLSATGMNTRRLAYAPTLTSGTKQVDLLVDSELELKNYLDAGGMQVAIDADLDPPPPDMVEIKIVFKVRVDVNVI
ncbi:MAG: hypothetical protein JRJ19_11350, partial [Deltaproteobacteria bacterium]|nr:hypothetical protein [Deltaproteobacteria bacterium]